MISILGVMPKSNYFLIQNLDLWTKERNAYLFNGNNKVITHAPCQQWSKLKAFAKVDILERDLAAFCFEKVLKNGGIFEHPKGSSFFKYIGANQKNIISINQSWFGFPAAKPTYLYFSNCAPGVLPLNFNAIKYKVADLHYSKRSLMPLAFCKWLVGSVEN